ncbi:MAG: chaperone modulatory protein CbpM [Baekduia sp.]|jgi:DNA-binding transcriptional MerR regulator|nr:chaperone modulatory protein CbpM [Baekduia sp.]MDX6729458.1 chaperone modulatory protein CbpM [Baekduia sp.]
MSLLVIHPRGRATVDQLARDAGLHPETVRRLLRLGLIAAPYPDDAPAQLARAIRLRRDLGLNLAGAVLACELLARIDDLEERLARSPSNGRHPR